MHDAIIVHAVVNGHCRPVVADTATARTGISYRSAKELNIIPHPSRMTRRFNGLVDPLASRSIGRGSYEVVAFAVEQHLEQPAEQSEVDGITQRSLVLQTNNSLTKEDHPSVHGSGMVY